MFRRACYYFVYLLIVWTIFRCFSRLPEVIEEVWFKTVIWLVPLFWLNLSTKKRIRFFDGGVRRMIVWGGGVGFIYFLLFMMIGLAGKRTIGIDSIGIGLVTAVVENMVFVGFLLPVFREKLSLFKSLLLMSLLFGVIHLPIAWLVYRLNPMMVLYLFGMMSLLGMINGWLRLKTNNVGTAILASWIWSVLALS